MPAPFLREAPPQTASDGTARMPHVPASTKAAAAATRQTTVASSPARAVQRGLQIPGRVHQAADVPELIAPTNTPRRDALAVLDSQPELVETLRAFIGNNVCMSDRAAQLHVHRNTLLHRLNRVRTLTGLDPRRRASPWESVP